MCPCEHLCLYRYEACSCLEEGKNGWENCAHWLKVQHNIVHNNNPFNTAGMYMRSKPNENKN